MIAFTPEQEEFRKSVARFVEAEVVPAAAALDERAEFPAALFRRIADLGWLALRYPEKYGGAEAEMTTYCLLAEELARGSLSLAAAACMQSLMGTHFIFKYGGDELRERYLAPALRGELVATFAMTVGMCILIGATFVTINATSITTAKISVAIVGKTVGTCARSAMTSAKRTPKSNSSA